MQYLGAQTARASSVVVRKAAAVALGALKSGQELMIDECSRDVTILFLSRTLRALLESGS